MPSSVAEGPTPSGSRQALETVRGALLGATRDRLSAAETTVGEIVQRLDDLETRSGEVAAALPQAVRTATDRDPQLATALRPTIEKALTDSVRDNPQPIVDAVFPVIGPAIRKSITEALRQLVQSINHTLENSVSAKAMGWRFEAWRTGKSFAEVVVARTLRYRVDQVFLIHRETGLLLLDVVADGAQAQDADIVSSMLTAIRDFASDSFTVEQGESLHTFQVGELTVWVEQGPHALLAGVIRGNAPGSLRVVMQETLESVHGSFDGLLANFTGDVDPFEAARDVLRPCLQSERREDEPAKRRISPAFAGAVALLLLLAAWWGWSRWDRSARWDAYLEALHDTPGLVVLRHEIAGGQLAIWGLRDPLADPPWFDRDEARVPEDEVAEHWTPAYSPAPEIHVRRAEVWLKPPPSVTFTATPGRLTATGSATAEWIAGARETWARVPGAPPASFADLDVQVPSTPR